jgi:hypothetical protein
VSGIYKSVKNIHALVGGLKMKPTWKDALCHAAKSGTTTDFVVYDCNGAAHWVELTVNKRVILSTDSEQFEPFSPDGEPYQLRESV